MRSGRYTKPEATARGARNGAAKLTEQQALDIYEAYFGSDQVPREIAERFGVSRSAVMDIITGRNWKHIHV